MKDSNPGLISEEYRELNRKLHDDPTYGHTGYKFAQEVANICGYYETKEVLDYGCGKQTLNQAIGDVDVTGYDPALAGLDATPAPHDIVVCTDVMEHIEPECLQAVLDDLKRVTKKALFVTIAMRPARKILPDGRNAHLIQEDYKWWIQQFWDRFHIRQTRIFNREILMLCEPIE